MTELGLYIYYGNDVLPNHVEVYENCRLLVDKIQLHRPQETVSLRQKQSPLFPLRQLACRCRHLPSIFSLPLFLSAYVAKTLKR